jgi:hypothetical protein
MVSAKKDDGRSLLSQSVVADTRDEQQTNYAGGNEHVIAK